jgi:hypothetical protein
VYRAIGPAGERGKREGGNLPIKMASTSSSLLSKQTLPRELQWVECWVLVCAKKEALPMMVLHKVALMMIRKYLVGWR